jgi:hypothetical protein
MSDAELSALNLEEDYTVVLRVEDAARWTLEHPDDLEVLATMSPAGAPEERYQARLLWASYPGAPPSLKFRDPATGRLDLPRAWPQAPGFRPSSLDACLSWTAEGQALHPEWARDPRYRWDPRGNVLLKVLRLLQEQLDDHYDGRQP